MNIGDKISSCRSELYGIAALEVILFHSFCVIPWSPLRVFSYGFIGVDMFLMIGAFCLCYSIQKNSLTQFYKNRFLRVGLLWIVVIALLFPIINNVISGCFPTLREILKWAWSATLFLPLWFGHGGCDWFTASLFHYYAVFPFLWKQMKRYNNTVIYAVSVVSCFLIVHFVIDRWPLDCFFSRVPAFVMGIIVYKAAQQHRAPRLELLISAMGAVVAWYFNHDFFLTSMICPFVVYSLTWVICELKKVQIIERLLSPIRLLGDHSLESYYGASVSGYVPHYIASLWGTCLYTTVSLLGCVFVSLINKGIKLVLKRF